MEFYYSCMTIYRTPTPPRFSTIIPFHGPGSGHEKKKRPSYLAFSKPTGGCERDKVEGCPCEWSSLTPVCYSLPPPFTSPFPLLPPPPPPHIYLPPLLSFFGQVNPKNRGSSPPFVRSDIWVRSICDDPATTNSSPSPNSPFPPYPPPLLLLPYLSIPFTYPFIFLFTLSTHPTWSITFLHGLL